jgi:antirestriction protein ArdC
MTRKKLTPDERKQRTQEQVAAIVAPIVEAIEAGTADPSAWRAPWHDIDPAHLMPINAATGNEYHGGNRLILALISATYGAAPQWATFKQWQSLSTDDEPVTVRKGEHAIARILRPMTRKETRDDGTERDRLIGWTAYPVFHAGQVDGYEAPPIPQPERTELTATERDDVSAAYLWAAGIGARVQESPTAGASYSPTLDIVTMPERDRFTSSHGTWSTMAHELTHWTGHESRLARDLANPRFGNHAYAAEELVAELGAAFTLAAIGRSSEPREDHAQYLASWLQVLKENPSHLWTVASAAQKGADYLTERATIAARPVAA